MCGRSGSGGRHLTCRVCARWGSPSSVSAVCGVCCSGLRSRTVRPQCPPPSPVLSSGQSVRTEAGAGCQSKHRELPGAEHSDADGRPRLHQTPAGSGSRGPDVPSSLPAHAPLTRPPPTSTRAWEALTPFQPYRFSQSRHLLSKPADPQEMTTTSCGGGGADRSRKGAGRRVSREPARGGRLGTWPRQF